MKDYEVAYKLSSIMESINGSAIYDNGEERAYITIPVNRILSLEMYGIKNPQDVLFDMCKANDFIIFIDDDNKLKPLIVIGCDRFIYYKKIVKLLYDFCKYVTSQTDKITIKLQDENEIAIELPLLCLLRCVQNDSSKEIHLILDIVENLISDEFGSDSYESVGIDGKETPFTHIGKYHLTIDFIDRDEIFKDINDIQTLSNIIHNASLKALDVIFKDYIN